MNFVLCMYRILIFHKFTSPLNGCRHDNIMYICCACWVIHFRWLLIRIGLWSSGQMYVLEFENQWDFFFFKATNNWYRLMLKVFNVFDFCIKWKYWSFLDRSTIGMVFLIVLHELSFLMWHAFAWLH
jgi:hypothetical protein